LANIEGSEARLGSAAFCGAADQGDLQTDLSSIVFTHADCQAVFEIKQRLRPDAVAVVRALLASGLDVRILSGDRTSAVEPVAAVLGVTGWQGGLKPADKIAAIEQLKAGPTRVLLPRPGPNHAPALPAAPQPLT